MIVTLNRFPPQSARMVAYTWVHYVLQERLVVAAIASEDVAVASLIRTQRQRLDQNWAIWKSECDLGAILHFLGSKVFT